MNDSQRLDTAKSDSMAMASDFISSARTLATASLALSIAALLFLIAPPLLTLVLAQAIPYPSPFPFAVIGVYSSLIVVLVWIATTILAIVLGLMARSSFRRSPGAAKGSGMATTGTVLGFFVLNLPILMLATVAYIGTGPHLSPRQHAIEDAQSTLENALTTAKTQYTQDGYTYATNARLFAVLARAEPQITFRPGNGNSHTPNTVIVVQRSLPTPDPHALLLGDASTDGTCWYILDIELPLPPSQQELGVSAWGTYYGYASASSNNRCSVANAPRHLSSAQHPGGWGDSFPNL